MSQLKIFTGQVMDANENLKCCIQDLEYIKQRVNNIKNGTDGRVLTNLNCGQSLGSAIFQLNEILEKLNNIYYATQNSAQLYEKVEKRLQAKNKDIAKYIGIFWEYSNGLIKLNAWDYAQLAFAGWNDRGVKILFGDDLSKRLCKENLLKLFKIISKKKGIPKVPKEIRTAIALYKETGKLDKDFARKNKKLIKQLGGIDKVLKYGEKGLEYLDYLYSDYKEGLDKFKLIKDTIKDPEIKSVMEEIIKEYENKFFGTAKGIVDWSVEKLESKLVDALASKTNGALTIASLASDAVSSMSGMDDHVAAIETNMLSSIYGDNFQMEYSSIMTKINSGDYNQSDIDKAKALFELTKQSKIQTYESAIKCAHSQQERTEMENQLKQIKQLKMEGL